jgi:hypothetical protein
MNKQEQTRFRWNAGRGMVAGIFIGAAVALVVSAITDDQNVWGWAIPVGLATGLAIGAGRQQKSEEA